MAKEEPYPLFPLRVGDFIMSRNGKIKKMILSVSGFLGIGDRLVAVPFKSLQIRVKGDIIYRGRIWDQHHWRYPFIRRY